MRRITEIVGTVYHGFNPERNSRAYISIVGTFNLIMVLLFLLLDTILSSFEKTVMPEPNGFIYLLCIIVVSVITIYRLLPEERLAKISVDKNHANKYARQYLIGFFAISVVLIIAIGRFSGTVNR